MSICKKRPQRKGIAKLEHVVFWHWIRLSYKVYICLNQFKSYFSSFSDFSQIWSYNSHLLVLLYGVFLLEPITSRGDNNHPGFGLRIKIQCLKKKCIICIYCINIERWSGNSCKKNRYIFIAIIWWLGIIPKNPDPWSRIDGTQCHPQNRSAGKKKHEIFHDIPGSLGYINIFL